MNIPINVLLQLLGEEYAKARMLEVELERLRAANEERRDEPAPEPLRDMPGGK